MIKNERQYKITKTQAEKFRAAIERFAVEAAADRKTARRLIKAQGDALRSQLEDLEREMREYEALEAGEGPPLELGKVAELPRMLIRARIAAGLSQKELAEQLGVAEQQIQRYEATEYESASLARVMEVAQVLSRPSHHDVERSRRSR